MPRLVSDALAGDRLALSRLLTRVENYTGDGIEALDSLFAFTGKAHLIGVTGSPGTGKSSLVNQIALQFRKQNKKVAIIAVDPSSPFSGGAILGDRIRMKDLTNDTGVFIRSLASRGSLGGLSFSTTNISKVFDAVGYDVVLIETVGAGQSEVEIARLAHTTLVVEAPGMGDDIQAIKAGILEIADILVINKADRDGAEQAESALRAMLDLDHPSKTIFHHDRLIDLPQPPQPMRQELWIPPILKTVATEGVGTEALMDAIDRHREFLKTSGRWKDQEREKVFSDLEKMLRHALYQRFMEKMEPADLEGVLKRLEGREISPQTALEILLNFLS